MRSLLMCAVAILAGSVLVGCGGGSSVAPPPGGGGAITGQLQGVASPQSYAIYVNGREVSARPAADGRFQLSNIPPGSHTISIVAGSGMSGAHRTCIVVDGTVTDIGTVVPQVGGQIVGLVMRRDDAGGLEALAGVEVLADPGFTILPVGPEPGDPGDPDDGWGGDGVIGGGAGPVSGPPIVQDAEAVPIRAVTNSAGSYLMPAVPPGAYVVTVNVPGLEQGVCWVWVEAGRTAVADFQLAEAIDPGVGTIRGTVLGETATGVMALEGAVVAVIPDIPWITEPGKPTPVGAAGADQGDSSSGCVAIVPPYRYEIFRTLTDSAGHYSLNVPSGRHTLEVWADGYEWVTAAVTVRPGDILVRDVTLKLWELLPVPMPPGVRGVE